MHIALNCNPMFSYLPFVGLCCFDLAKLVHIPESCYVSSSGDISWNKGY